MDSPKLRLWRRDTPHGETEVWDVEEYLRHVIPYEMPAF